MDTTDTMKGLPIERNPNAARYNYPTRLVPIMTDEVQTGWEEVHVNSRLTIVRRDSPGKLRALGFSIPFLDYDPISEDLMRHAATARMGLVWTGD